FYIGQTGDDGINTGRNNVTTAAGEIIGLQSNYGCSTKGSYQPAGNYAARGESYTKRESDDKYQPRGNYQPAGSYQPKGNYQPAGNYAVRGECYTRGESDSRYLKSRGGTTLVYNGSGITDGQAASLSQDCRGRFMFFQDTDGHYTTLAIFPEDGATMGVTSGSSGYAHLRLENNGRTLRCVYQGNNAKVSKVWVL
ncbi:hypothetical protein PSI23_21330, partial [Xenorhabdus sp. XENO-10]|nr:hypothetical protein [Xenorhabdus yunnanensis]